MSTVLVFVFQFAMVFSLGFQSRNIRDGQYTMAAITSLVLGCLGVVNQVLVIKSTMQSDWLPLVAFVLAGPPGICLAMWVHDKVK